MNALFGLGIVAALIYGFYIYGTYLKIYLLLVISYTLLTQIGTLTKYNNKRKKSNIATWSPPNNPEILASFEWDTTKAQEFLAKKRESSGLALTLTHLVGYAVARGLSQAPNINGRIAFGNYRICRGNSPVFQDPKNQSIWGELFRKIQYYPNERLGVSFLVAMDNGNDLGSHTVEDADHKRLEDFCTELSTSSRRIRSHKDKQHASRTGALAYIPTFIIEPILFAVGYIACCLNISVPMFGFKKNAFGACLVTSVGMLGYDNVFAPIPPFTHVPIVVTVGANKKRAMVVENEIKIRDVINISITMDHRFADGAASATMYKKFTECLQDPAEIISLEEPCSASVAAQSCSIKRSFNNESTQKYPRKQ